MMMKKSLVTLFFWALVLVVLGNAQTEDTRPNVVAVVFFADGSTVELTELSIFGEAKRPTLYFKTEHRAGVPGIPVREGRFWRLIPLRQVRHATFTNDTGKLELDDGTSVEGDVPRHPGRETWLHGDTFRFIGRKSVLGAVGEFAIARRDVAKISRKPEKLDEYDITDTNGEVTTVTELKFVRAWRSAVGWRSSFSSRIRFNVDETVVGLRLGDISRLEFPDKIGDPIGIKMKSGEEAKARLEHSSDCESVFGKTATGRILFTPIREAQQGKPPRVSVKAIEFK